MARGAPGTFERIAAVVAGVFVGSAVGYTLIFGLSLGLLPVHHTTNVSHVMTKTGFRGPIFLILSAVLAVYLMWFIPRFL